MPASLGIAVFHINISLARLHELHDLRHIGVNLVASDPDIFLLVLTNLDYFDFHFLIAFLNCECPFPLQIAVKEVKRYRIYLLDAVLRIHVSGSEHVCEER